MIEVLKVGEMVRRTPATFASGTVDPFSIKPIELYGKVVFVNERGRFHVVEFQTPGGPIREAFKGVD